MLVDPFTGESLQSKSMRKTRLLTEVFFKAYRDTSLNINLADRFSQIALKEVEREHIIPVAPPPIELPRFAERILDLLLEPTSAESAIGDLTEHFVKRRARDPKFAIAWLCAQMGWITFGRVMEVWARVNKARSGG